MDIQKDRRRFVKYLMSLAGFTAGSLISVKKTTPGGPINLRLFPSRSARGRETEETAYRQKIIAV
jgi:hypothetical protein